MITNVVLLELNTLINMNKMDFCCSKEKKKTTEYFLKIDMDALRTFFFSFFCRYFMAVGLDFNVILNLFYVTKHCNTRSLGGNKTSMVIISPEYFTLMILKMISKISRSGEHSIDVPNVRLCFWRGVVWECSMNSKKCLNFMRRGEIHL
uniref:Alpha-dioxygenase 2-like n=1 Tax=Rhizophora mucronata TaxID=61149 RepID=A0A2P2LZ48_RHIMU